MSFDPDDFRAHDGPCGYKGHNYFTSWDGIRRCFECGDLAPEVEAEPVEESND